jgi:putative membrane protein
MYVGALANLDFSILIPMVPGLALGAIGISFIMSLLFKRFYSVTYSVIFGIFLSMIPNMLSDNCVLGWNSASVLSLALLILGFGISFYLGDIQTNNARLRAVFKERKAENK